MANSKVYSNKIEVRVDRRTELLGILQVISNYRDMYPDAINSNKPYVKQIVDRFSKYKNHQTVEIFNEIIMRHNFGYDLPMTLFLSLNEDFSYETLEDSLFRTRLKSDPLILELLDSLKDFASIIGYNDYYQTNQEQHQIMIANVKAGLDRSLLIDYLEDFYGQKIDGNFIVNLIPFHSQNHYGSTVGKDRYSMISGEDYRPNPSRYLYHTFHEFSHSIVNPLTKKHNLISEENNVFQNIKEIMKNNAYGINESIINEHIIRAATFLYISSFENDYEQMEKDIKWEKKLGFLAIEEVIGSLLYYQKNRDIYPDLDSYYPTLINDIIDYYQNQEAILSSGKVN